MSRFLLLIFGAASVFMGIAGYSSYFVYNHLLFGLFEGGRLYYLLCISVGALAILASTRPGLTRLFLLIIGISLTLLALFGFWRQGNLSILHVNLADNILHLIVGVCALYLGCLRHGSIMR